MAFWNFYIAEAGRTFHPNPANCGVHCTVNNLPALIFIDIYCNGLLSTFNSPPSGMTKLVFLYILRPQHAKAPAQDITETILPYCVAAQAHRIGLLVEEYSTVWQHCRALPISKPFFNFASFIFHIYIQMCACNTHTHNYAFKNKTLCFNTLPGWLNPSRALFQSFNFDCTLSFFRNPLSGGKFSKVTFLCQSLWWQQSLLILALAQGQSWRKGGSPCFRAPPPHHHRERL